MNVAFGGSFEFFDDTRQPGADPLSYSESVRRMLAELRAGDKGIVRIRRPRPTAAFSPQDTAHQNYEQAKLLVSARGFEPVERGTGGRLTVFDERALGITIIAPHAHPHTHMMKRYEWLSNAIVGGLRALGIDAHIGELPNEYCPGKFSINAGKRIKLVGVAQRMNSRAYQMGAVISVDRSAAACAAFAEAYQAMSLPFDPATYGGMTDLIPGLTYEEVGATLLSAVMETVA